MSPHFIFCLVVGIGSTIALDVWQRLIAPLTGIQPANWGVVGQWLFGVTKGRWFFNADDAETPQACHKTAGWIFHYVVGIAYAVLLLIFGGLGYLHAPTPLPAVIVGVVISTFAGLVILTPALGGGLFASATPAPWTVRLYVLICHGVFALAQYGLAVFLSTSVF